MSCLLAWCLILSTSAPAVWALQAGNIISQSGIIGTPTWGDNTVINTDHQAIINWNNFNTSSTQSVTFNQYKDGSLSSLSAVLNRISSGAVPTQFNGALNANGRVFIVNPAGIFFGSGSQINVTQLVASGLNMSDTNFLDATDGSPADFVFGSGNGEVTNRATIHADSVFLIGKKVINYSAILANDGLIVMAAGENVYIAQDGSNVVVQVSEGYYTSSPADSVDDVQNRSLISAENGKIVLAAGDTFSRAVSNAGILAASGGEVTMQAAKVDNKGRIITSSSSGNGGSVNLIGTEGVTIEHDILGNPGSIEANAGPNGDGGSVTIQTDGLFRLDDISSISANGGGVSGNGGSVSITCGDFEIAGDILASPGNKTEEPGTLEINTPSNVIIADGANAGATDTLYEDDIETLSQGATSLNVNAQEGITVKDITDNEITGQFGNIELHATGNDSAVSFADNTDTIRTTLGDIVIGAGSGGINVGNLTTGKDITDEKPTPGQILLSTSNGGNITTGDLTIRDGWGHAEINVDSSGDLTVNGDVIAGSGSDILNVADQKAAEAVIKLSADNDVMLNGVVGAHANGMEEDTSTTKATVDIIAGNNANIGDILAKATSSSTGTADAVINVEAVGNIVFAEGAEAHAIANQTEVQGIISDEKPNPPVPGDHAQIIINESAILLVDDNFSTSKSVVSIQLDVLANDTQGGGPLVGGSIDSYTQPTAGTLTPNMSGDKIVGFTYTPPADLHTLTFNESGEATVTFTYTVSGHTATATITLTNGLPTADGDLVSTFLNKAVKINVLSNDTDPDKDALTPVLGTVTTKNGTLVLNEDHTFTYTPNEGYLGDDSFMYSVSDGYNTSSEVEVKITVSEQPPAPLALPYIQSAPGLDRVEWINVEVSGCPALVKWAAEEVGIDKRLVQIWVSNSLASAGDIQPCDACERLRNAAKILQDADGTHIAALTQVINEFASSTAPPTEEQMTAIADAIRRNTDEESYYAVAGEYLDALVTYVGVLNSDMGFSSIESVQLVTDKYISRLTKDQNVGVAAFLAASLAALGG